MPIITDGAITNPLRPITDYQTPFGDYISAKAKDAFQGIQDRMGFIGGQRDDNTVIGFSDFDGTPIYGQTTDTPKLSAADAKTQIEAAGVKLDSVPDDGMYQDTLDSLVRRKQEQIARQIAVDGYHGALGSVAGFGTSLAVSMLDPVNVAASFVPVIGPARYGALLANAGGAVERAAIRGGIGALEGAAGNVLLTPLDAAVARTYGDDYTMVNALENVAFGAAFGGGLHVMGGALKDRISGVSKEPIRVDTESGPVNVDPNPAAVQPRGAAWIVRNANQGTISDALRVAVGQAIDGRVIDVEPIFRNDARVQYETARLNARPADATEATARALENLTPQIRAELEPVTAGLAAAGDVSAMRARLGELADESAGLRQELDGFTGEGNRTARKAEHLRSRRINERLGVIEQEVGQINDRLDANRQAAQAQQGLASLDRGEVPDAYRDQVNQEAGRLLSGDVRTPVAGAVDRLFAEAANPIEQMTAASRRLGEPESVAVGSTDSSRAAQARLDASPAKAATPETADATLTAANERFERVAAELEASGFSKERLAEVRAMLAPFDEALAESEKLGDAFRVAALCGVRNGL